MQKVPLNKEQRVGVVLLSVLTLGIILVTVLQFRSGLYEFATRQKTDLANSTDPAVQQQAEIDRLKKTDTDKDGLSDYDELTIYHTSPYLRDTDGDGIPDGEEVRRGTSPVCPEGKDCSINPLYVAPKNGSASSTPDSVSAKPTIDNTLAPAVNPPTDTSANADIKKLRDTLLQNGIKKEQLDQLTDDELVQLLVEAQKNQTATPPTTPAPTPTKP